MAVGVWHCALFICHVIAMIITLCIGIYLVIKQNMVFTSLAVIKSVREDHKVHPSEAEVMNENSPPEAAVKNIRTCLLVCGAITLIISLFITVNLYCFLAVLLEPGSTMMNSLPGMSKIRERMEVEVAESGIQEEHQMYGVGSGGGGTMSEGSSPAGSSPQSPSESGGSE